MSTVIKVENLGKQYRLGEIGTGTLSHDLNRWWARVRGKEDPFAKIGEANDRTRKGESEYVWALKDINFEVQAGEVLGIIGRNGAGKSTLLKILSKVTKPTTGQIKTRGRIASLLEVGTGFHPEMTGRENVFLNGAIMGMTKNEITRKFDEIVDFAGVERYIDTPVKRYSSGMHVRLGFAVAAHLEPEILIVDEVLAVGDAEFQKKCLGKMKDVSVNDGRTVLFVSHNIIALRNLCDRGLLLKNGMVNLEDKIESVISNYVENNSDNKISISSDEVGFKHQTINVLNIKLRKSTDNSDPEFYITDELDFIFEFEIIVPVNLNISLAFYTVYDEHVLNSVSLDKIGENYKLEKGYYSVTCKIPANFFNEAKYQVSILFVENYSNVLLHLEKKILSEMKEDLSLRKNFLGTW
ncbi:MAG: ABC transporter ATP-binding protein, partial [Mucilaginibacter sp.]